MSTKGISKRRLAHGAARVIFGHQDLEAEPTQRFTDDAGIVRRLFQRHNIPIAVIADHQRNALFGACRLAEREQKRDNGECDKAQRASHHGHMLGRQDDAPKRRVMLFDAVATRKVHPGCRCAVLPTVNMFLLDTFS